MEDCLRTKEELIQELVQLRERLAKSEKAQAERNETEEQLKRLVECIHNLGVDPLENINHLTILCGEIMHATCAMYNRLHKGILCSWGQWKTPQDYNPVDRPEGHICHDVITRAGDTIMIVRDLQQSLYAETDPNVIHYGLSTYIGHVVKLGDTAIGSLCAVYQDDFVPSKSQQALMGGIAAAIGIEERRRNAEEALLEEKAFTDNALERITDAFLVFNLSGRFLRWNRAVREVTGYTDDEISSMTPTDFFSGVDVERVSQAIGLAMKEGHATVEASVVTKQENRILYEFTGDLLQDHEGNPTSICVTGRDITDRQKAQEALRASEEKYRTIIENMEEGYFEADLKGNMVFFNDYACTILGYSRQELTGMNYREYMDEENARKVFETFNSLYRTGNPPELFDWVIIRKDGIRRIVETPVALIRDADGRPRGFRGLGRDVTARREAEQALQKAHEELERRVQERTAELVATNKRLRAEIAARRLAEVQLRDAKESAENADRAKSDFLTNMSHELRTPLNAIIGFTELLEDQSAGELNEEQSQYVRDVLSAGRHLLVIINDILDLSKVESGKMDLEISAIHLRTLMESSLMMIKEKALKHQLKTELSVENDLEYPRIEADEVKVKQIMFNLLSNAAKFTPDGGKITVEVMKHGEEIYISVSDTGIGLKPEDQQRIFGVFEQVDSSYARRQQGTGLGLALTRRLVELHGGRIWAESDGEGKGSTFTFAIPFVKTVEAESDPGSDQMRPEAVKPQVPIPAREDLGRASPTVLVVEDNDTNMNLVIALLQAARYRVLQATTAEEGIVIARKKVPDLILMDVGLPRMDGLTATEILKENQETRSIPILALTAHAAEGDEAKALAAGCSGYISKPIDTRAFSKTLAGFIEAARDG